MVKKKITALFSLIIILTFIGYIILDTSRSNRKPGETNERVNIVPPEDSWSIINNFYVNEGLKAVSAGPDGKIYAGGNSFIISYDNQLNKLWQIETLYPVTALTVSGDSLFATSQELIFVLSTENGEIINEWGPYEANSIITSVSANNDYLAVADAGNKIVFILKKDGEVRSMIGHFEDKLIIPSPYFDICFTEDNMLYLAHTGKHRIEKWTADGRFISSFGESGTEPDYFCGCCNPAHFSINTTGFVTAEKGINRIKILGEDGDFIEYVSSENDFSASAPLDVTTDGNFIYGANPADSRIYIFQRK